MLRDNIKFIIPAVAVLVIIIVAGWLLTQRGPAPITTTSSLPTTTIVQKSALKALNGCTNINAPGTYYLNGSIETGISSKPCLNITSSNVTILGRDHVIRGSGPYVGTPPFSYAMAASGVQNVMITNLTAVNFSYGIYFDNVGNSTIFNANLSRNTVSDVYLLGSNNNKIYKSIMSASLGPQGGLGMQGSNNNTIFNDTIENNARIGLTVNASGNSFNNDVIVSSPVDVECAVGPSVKTNVFRNVECFTNNYCTAAVCSTYNTPAALSSITLGNSVNSCGGIYGPGNYTLNSDLNVLDYLNMSNPLAREEGCITINAPNVRLNCNGHTIENGAYGVIANNTAINVKNCRFVNDTTGFTMSNTYLVTLSNSTFSKGTYGIYLYKMTTGSVSNVTATGEDYGVYLDNTDGISFDNLQSMNNTYGIYLVNSTENVYNGGKLQSNTQADLYCDAASYRSSANLFQGTSCGVTDCLWGSTCSKTIPAPMSLYSINNCTSINYPGIYEMSGPILGTPNCITINANNVNLNCENYTIQGAGNTQGSAIVVSNSKTAMINDCRITGYQNGINITNSAFINLYNTTINGVNGGVYARNAANLHAIRLVVAGFKALGAFRFYNVTDSIINNNTASTGGNIGNGFLFNNSSMNIIASNKAQNGNNGFMFQDSGSNNFFNNTADSNNIDYACAGSGDTGVFSEIGNGINNGTTKVGCRWMIVLNALTQQSCMAISNTNLVSLDGDQLYTAGTTCYSLYNIKGSSTTSSNSLNTTFVQASSANGTVINCNNHTILATKGGIFANVNNVSNVRIENCYLKNFTTAIRVRGPQYGIINNTILNSGIGIDALSGKYSSVYGNRIYNSTQGISMDNSSFSNIENNYVANTQHQINLTDGTGYIVRSNAGTIGKTGMYIYNVTQSQFGNNNFNGTSDYGFECGLNSNQTYSLNRDNGGNACSKNIGCAWMSASSSCAPT